MIARIPFQSHVIVGTICLSVGIAIGLSIGWKLYKPTEIIETAQPQQVLEDLNVTVLERVEKPVEPTPKPLKKAAKQLNGKLERTATIVIQPVPKAGSPTDCECEEVNLDVGIVDTGDGKRIVTHTENGTIVGGTDVPLEPYTKSRSMNWEIGAVVPVENPEGIGPYVARKIGPFSVGVQAMQPSSEEGWTAMATFGVRF